MLYSKILGFALDLVEQGARALRDRRVISLTRHFLPSRHSPHSSANTPPHDRKAEADQESGLSRFLEAVRICSYFMEMAIKIDILRER